MQEIEICGQNQNYAIGETSNGKDKYNNKIINPPLTSKFEASSVLSYSTYFQKSVIITTDGAAYAIGNNSNGEISNSLPLKILDNFTKINITDKEKNPYNFISVICGTDYTQHKNKHDCFAKQFESVKHCLSF